MTPNKTINIQWRPNFDVPRNYVVCLLGTACTNKYECGISSNFANETMNRKFRREGVAHKWRHTLGGGERFTKNPHFRSFSLNCFSIFEPFSSVLVKLERVWSSKRVTSFVYDHISKWRTAHLPIGWFTRIHIKQRNQRINWIQK